MVKRSESIAGLDVEWPRVQATNDDWVRVIHDSPRAHDWRWRTQGLQRENYYNSGIGLIPFPGRRFTFRFTWFLFFATFSRMTPRPGQGRCSILGIAKPFWTIVGCVTTDDLQSKSSYPRANRYPWACNVVILQATDLLTERLYTLWCTHAKAHQPGIQPVSSIGRRFQILYSSLSEE